MTHSFPTRRSSDLLPRAVESRPDVGRSLTCDHDVRIDELHSLPKAEIDIADVASSENAGGSVCRERLVVHSPVQADEVEGVAQRLQRAKDEGIEESNLDIRQRIERGKVIVEPDDAVVVEQ